MFLDELRNIYINFDKMIDNLPFWIDALFVLTWIVTLVFFFFANGKAKRSTFVIIIWSLLQSCLAYSGFYQNTTDIPPRFGLVLIPATAFIIYGLLPNQQKWFIEHRNSTIATFLHSVRVPVELCLFGLFTYKMIPELMTFEGWNFDIIMGISAPIIGLLLYRQRANKTLLILWNILGLILVSSIMIMGILSAELPFQQLAFDQPNRAVLYFPYILLPAVIVPIVIWTHVSELIRIFKS